MKRLGPKSLFLILLAHLCAVGLVGHLGAAEPENRPEAVDSGDHIRPILSQHCFGCHGPDEKKREGDLRLDVDSDVFVDRGGYSVVVPGSSEESELFLRITSKDAEFRMPPPKRAEGLSPDQIELIGRWIEQGARWEEH